jgi:hypothetical protein
VQPIARVVNAMASQRRVIIWLECHHKISLTEHQLESLPHDYLEKQTQTGHMECPFCPDPPQVTPRKEKSATQLYREAGEP